MKCLGFELVDAVVEQHNAVNEGQGFRVQGSVLSSFSAMELLYAIPGAGRCLVGDRVIGLWGGGVDATGHSCMLLEDSRGFQQLLVLDTCSVNRLMKISLTDGGCATPSALLLCFWRPTLRPKP